MRTPAEILALYFNFGRYLLLTPFGLASRNKTGVYMCTRPPLLLRLIMAGMQFGSISLMILFDWAGGSEQSLLRNSVYSLVYAFVTVGLVTLWRSGEQFAFILNAVNQLPISMKTTAGITPLSTKKVSRNAAVATTFIILYTLIDLLTYYTHFYHGFYKGLEHYLKPSYNIFHGKNNCSLLISDGNQDGCEFSFGAVALAILMWISEGVIQNSHLFLNLLCFVHADILLYFVHTLLAHIRFGGNRAGKSCIIQVASEMLQLSAAIEDGLGAIVLSFLLALIPYYSLNMQYVLNRDNYHKLARHVVKSTMFTIVLLTAAEANSKMKRVGSELAALLSSHENGSAMMSRTEIMNQADRENTLLLLHRIASNDFGLQGKAFTVTYGLVGSVAGLVVTYSIIIYQFQGN